MSDSKIEVTRIVSLAFEENCYIFRLPQRHDCLIVDPGLEPAKILQHLDAKQLVPAAILNTHGHSDHIAGNAVLKERWPECPIVIGADEAAKLTDPRLNLSAMFGVALISPPADVTVVDGQTYSAAGCELLVRKIAGHSTGHVVYIALQHNPPLVFAGDVIFAGSVGRTDFPDGDFEQLKAGIETCLFTLPDETILMPGHGPPTTVGQEKRTNPYVGL